MKKSFAAVFFFLLGALAWADIAPPTFHGGGINPLDGTVVTMESASVEIRWGTPSNLRAVFVMQNPSDLPQEVLVGFPRPFVADTKEGAVPDPLTISFNGGNAETMDAPAKGSEYSRYSPHGWFWCSRKHSFAPGKTVVEVNAALRASLKKVGYWESLLYCIESGGKWAGEIGAEDVVIIFPSAIRDGQIVEAKPAGAKIEGDRVSWSFKNFKPKANEFDVKLTYVRPDFMDKIEELRNELRRQPQSAAAAIKLAKHLLALGPGYSNGGSLPGPLTRDEYEKIAASIKSEKDRRLFAYHYAENSPGGFGAKWFNDRDALVKILAEAGYDHERSRTSFVKEGEALLLGVLEKDKRNAEAWNVYLANYWRFAFAGYGHWWHMAESVMTKKQAALIEEAVRNCPKDECIALWGKEIKRASKGWRIDDSLLETISEKGYYSTEFPRVEYGYY